MIDKCQAGPAASAWRADVEALTFRPAGHGGVCMVHRHAFRTLLGHYPSPEECAALFDSEAAAFEAAAAAKIARAGIAPDTSLHLTSRDLRRVMTKLPVASPERSG